MKIYALIPARSGSKGLPDKNILEIDGHPLLSYAIAFARALHIDKVILSTDSERYAEIGRRYGATCPCLRSFQASSDTAMEEDILADMAEKFPSYGIEMPDIWVRLKPTTPFRQLDSVREGLNRMQSSSPPDSVRIVSPEDARLWRIDDEGFLEPAVPNWDPGRSVMRRTEFPATYSPFNLDIFFHKNWLRWGSAYMGKKIFPIVDHPITGFDINGRDDFDIVKSIIEARPRADVVARYLIDPDIPQ